MPCPACGKPCSSYTGVRFPICQRRANKFHLALGIPTWMDVGQCYICFEHFKEEELIVNEAGLILGVQREAVPNPRKTNPDWAQQRRLQQEARMQHWIDCPFCGLQFSGVDRHRIWKLTIHIEAEHGLRADMRNLNRLVMERRRKREHFNINQFLHRNPHIQIPPETSSASATVAVSIGQNVLPPSNNACNAATSSVICGICEEAVLRNKLRLHMFGVHNMIVTDMGRCFASNKPAPMQKRRQKEEMVDEREETEDDGEGEGKNCRIGYYGDQHPCSSSSALAISSKNKETSKNMTDEGKVKAEIVEEEEEENEDIANGSSLNKKTFPASQLDNGKMETTAMDGTSPSNPPPPPPFAINSFLRTFLKNIEKEEGEGTKREEQMDWALAMAVAVAQENEGNVGKKSGTAGSKNDAVPRHQMPSSSSSLRPPSAAIKLRLASSSAIPGNNNNIHCGPLHYSLYPPAVHAQESTKNGGIKRLGGVLSPEYVPSKQLRKQMAFSAMKEETNSRLLMKQKLLENAKIQEILENELKEREPTEFACPLCDHFFHDQNDLRWHLVHFHHIPPSNEQWDKIKNLNRLLTTKTSRTRTTDEERRQICGYKAQNRSNQWIARKLGRSHTTINKVAKKYAAEISTPPPPSSIRQNDGGNTSTESDDMPPFSPPNGDDPTKPSTPSSAKPKNDKISREEEELAHAPNRLMQNEDTFGRICCLLCEQRMYPQYFRLHLNNAHKVVGPNQKNIHAMCRFAGTEQRQKEKNADRPDIAEDDIQIKAEPETNDNGDDVHNGNWKALVAHKNGINKPRGSQLDCNYSAGHDYI